MGNICRSPTAEGVFRHLVEKEGLGDQIEVDSAGTHAYHVNEPADRRASAAAMELLNAVNRFEDTSPQGRAVKHEALEAVVLMLSPMTPHICHALWAELGHDTPLVDRRWPAVDETALELDTIELVVQVNGKLRGRVAVPAQLDVV